MSQAVLVPLVVVGFGVVFPLFWSGVVWMIGIGWRRLAATYPADDWPSDGYRLSGQSAMLGASRYSGVLTFVATESGLYVRPMLLFRVGHPPVLIPWSAVEYVEPALFSARVALVEAPDLVVPSKLADAIQAATDAADSARLGAEAERGDRA